MRNEISIKSLLDAVTVPADWVGLREVYESNTPRMIRDGVPVSNGHYSTHGAMVEVLVNGPPECTLRFLQGTFPRHQLHLPCYGYHPSYIDHDGTHDAFLL